jgi:hypothetical protein
VSTRKRQLRIAWPNVAPMLIALVLAGCNPESSSTRPASWESPDRDAGNRPMTESEAVNYLSRFPSYVEAMRRAGLPEPTGGAHEMRDQLRPTTRPSFYYYPDLDAETPQAGADVTSSGALVGGTQVTITASYAGEAILGGYTTVTEGRPWRVSAKVSGSYTSTTGSVRSLPSNLGCNGFPTEKNCSWGEFLRDVDCYLPNGGTGYVHASSIHRASFLSGPIIGNTFDRAICGFTVPAEPPPPLIATCGDPYATNYGYHAQCEYPYGYDTTAYHPPPTYSPGGQGGSVCWTYYTYWYTVDANGNRTSDYYYGQTETACSYG